MRPASTRAGAWSLWPATIPTDCGCEWLWYRRLLSGGHVYSGCVGHGSGKLWTGKTQLFRVVPDATT